MWAQKVTKMPPNWAQVKVLHLSIGSREGQKWHLATIVANHRKHNSLSRPCDIPAWSPDIGLQNKMPLNMGSQIGIFPTVPSILHANLGQISEKILRHGRITHIAVAFHPFARQHQNQLQMTESALNYKTIPNIITFRSNGTPNMYLEGPVSVVLIALMYHSTRSCLFTGVTP